MINYLQVCDAAGDGDRGFVVINQKVRFLIILLLISKVTFEYIVFGCSISKSSHTF